MNFEEISALLDIFNQYAKNNSDAATLTLNLEQTNYIKSLLQDEYNKANPNVSPAQSKYISDICAYLQITAPTDLDKQSANQWIQIHAAEMKQEQARRKKNAPQPIVFSPASYRFHI